MVDEFESGAEIQIALFPPGGERGSDYAKIVGHAASFIIR